MTRVTIAALLLASTAGAKPAPCPIEAPALAKLRSEHAAMNAAGVACLQALDATRAERDRCSIGASEALDDMARDLAEAGAALDAAHVALATPVQPPPSGLRPWVLVAASGALAGGVAMGARAMDLEAEGMAIATAGAVAGATLLALAFQWAGLE